MYLTHTFKLVSALLKHRSYFLVASGILQKFTRPKELEFLLGNPKFSNNHDKMLSSGDLGIISDAVAALFTLTLQTALSTSTVTPVRALNINSGPRLGINSNLDSDYNLETSLSTSFFCRAVVKTLRNLGEDFFEISDFCSVPHHHQNVY